MSDITSFTITVAPPPLIQGVELAGTNLVLTWTAIYGKTYRVEYTDRLDAPGWSNLPANVTASGPTAWSPNALDTAQRFYRIMSLE